MELLVLDAKIRDGKVSPNQLRRQGIIPAVCYGKGFENRTIAIEYQNFRKLYKETGTTQVFNLKVDKDTVPVLIHEISYNPLSDRYDHIDFLQIDMKKKVTATVPVEVTGLSPAVKNFNAVITMVKQEIEVKCLPMDIPHEITIDVSKLENIGDTVYVKELNLGDKVEVLEDPEEPVVSVNAAEEYKEEVAEVPEELKTEPVAGAEGEKAAAEGEKGGEEGEKADKKD
jgi:large subunit ribosomal protein L25